MSPFCYHVQTAGSRFELLLFRLFHPRFGRDGRASEIGRDFIERFGIAFPLLEEPKRTRKYNNTENEVRGDVLRPPHKHLTSAVVNV